MEKEVLNNNVDPSLFEFVQIDSRITDTKMATKKIGYFKDAFIRFCRNKASIAASVIILILVLFAIIAPEASSTPYTETRNDVDVQLYQKLLPKTGLTSKLGFWDGTKSLEVSEGNYYYYNAIGVETGMNPVVDKSDKYMFNGLPYYNIKYDSYYGLGMYYMTFTEETYKKIQEFQDENNIQII